MIIKLKCWPLFVAALLISSCQKEDVEPKPTIITIESAALTEGGIIFKGELTYPDLVEEHGFVYSVDSTFTNQPPAKINLGIPSKGGLFEHEVSTGLEKDRVYFYKAYIVFEQQVVYGERRSFMSNGSKPPEIFQIAPEIGHMGDTITITGRNFGYPAVRFSQKYSRLLTFNDSIITCLVPEDLENHILSAWVTAYDKSDSVPFSLYTPIIESIDPGTATFRDIVEITGQHFDQLTGRNRISLGGIQAEIISSERNKITFRVPDDLQSSQIEISLFSQLQEVLSPDKFELIPPEIISSPLCASSMNEIEIQGKFFHPEYYRNKVLMEGVEAEVLSGSTTSLKLRIPIGPFPQGNAQLSVEVADLRVDSEKVVCIEDDWLMISKSLPIGTRIGSFTVNNKAYVLGSTRDFSNPQAFLWEFNDTDYSWTKSELPFELNYSGTVTSNATKAYFYTAKATDNFWEYDPLNKTWTKKASFPGARRDNPVSFSIGDNIYVGIGADLEPYDILGYNDFYKYDPNLNQWVEVSPLGDDPTLVRIMASTFTLGGYAYLVGGALTSGMVDSWKYDGSTDQWQRITDFPDARLYSTAFTLDAKGYVANGTQSGGSDGYECVEFDPTNNSWNPFLRIGHFSRSFSFSFVVNGKAYVGGGYSDYNESAGLELFVLRR